MELRHLRYFAAVAEEENITRAAEKLHVSQPALSRQVRDLEEELGVSLLERSAKTVRLTEAGRVFLVEARAVLNRSEEAVSAVRAVADGARGEIHVGYAPSLTIEILPRALRAFQADYPKVRVALHDVSTEEMLKGLRDGELQVGLGVRPVRGMGREWHFQEIGRYPMCVAVAPRHRFAKKRELALEELAGEPMIAYAREAYPEYHAGVARLFKPAGINPQIVEEHDSVTSLIAAVEAGRGYALVTSCLKCLAGPRLELIPLAESREQVVVGAIRRRQCSTATILQFIAAASGDD